jgi:transcriptional regulator with XRE-family HTH domain
MNPLQSKMARVALGWSVSELATAAGVGRATAARFELGQNVQPAKVEAMRSAFVREGIAFTNGGGRQGVSYLRRD